MKRIITFNGLNHENLKTMTIQEVANRLVELCRQGQFTQAMNELYSDDIISTEPEGHPNREIRGIKAVLEKSKEFEAMVEEHYGGEVSDPIVAENFFSISMKSDVKFKGGPRIVIEEICVYNVKDGKIVKEQFFFTPQQS